MAHGSASLYTPSRARGLRLAIDDVGAGHSSFRHVLELRPDLIKLDMSLTRAIDADPARRALADCITRFSREMGCEVVAEGVETPAELDALRRIGVTKVQGYLVGRPYPLAAAAMLPIRGLFGPTGSRRAPGMERVRPPGSPLPGSAKPRGRAARAASPAAGR